MEELPIKRLSFTKRPIPVPADYRPMYKIALIVLILKLCCRSEKSSLLKLHLFSWALTAKEHSSAVIDYIDSNFKRDLSVWSIEPALNRALLLASAEHIVEVTEGKNYRLTDDKGQKFYQMLSADSDLMSDEKAFLNKVGKNKITDARINSMTRQWSLFYAKN